jgi:plasmid replication initiation protein
MVIRRFLDRQFDLFVPFISDMPLRDQRETMERPFFSLSKSKRIKPIEYTSPDGSVFVNVFPHQEYGMATIWDADILIWAASSLHGMKRKGINDLPRTLNFQPADLLRAINREGGGREYRLLREALGRLQSTVIRTNIRADKARRKERQFGWIESWSDLVDKETGQSCGMTLTLSEWFYEGIVMDGGVLAIDPAYFAITSGRERWLYRVARKHAGGAGPQGFSISLPTLFEKSGADGAYRRFKFEIQAIARRNALPEFALLMEPSAGQKEPTLLMVNRDAIGNDLTAVAPKAARKASPAKKVPRLPSAQPDSQLQLGLSRPLRQCSDEGLARIRRDFPGWDIYALKSQFDNWLADDADREPSNYETAFYGFVRRYNERNKHQLR